MPRSDSDRGGTDYRFGLLTAVPVAALYLPLALFRSAWSDDFPSLTVDAGNKAFADLRPVSGILHRVAFSGVHDIGSLWLLRGLGVAGIVLFAVATWHHLRRWGLSTPFSVLAAISVVLLPPFHSFAGWAQTWLVPYMFLTGGIAGLLVSEPSRHTGWRRPLVGVILLTTALLMYPPAAMFSWGCVGIRAAIRRTPFPLLLRESLRLGAMIATSGAIALTGAVAVNAVAGIDSDPRVQVIRSLAEALHKAIWFLTHPLVVAARPFQISSPSTREALLTGGVTLVLIAIGLVLRSTGSLPDRVKITALLFALAILTLSTHLVVPDNQIEYRFMTGLSITMWLYLLIVLTTVYDFLAAPEASPVRQFLQRTLPVAGLSALALTCVVAANLAWINVHQVFIDPSRTKETFLVRELERFDDGNYDEILIINPPYEEWPVRENLGIYSTQSDLSHNWVAIPNVRLLLEEHSLGIASIPITQTSAAGQVAPEVFILDLNPLLEETMSRAGFDDPNRPG